MKTPKLRRCPTCGNQIRLAHINGATRWVHRARMAGKLCAARKAAQVNATRARAGEGA